jgi:hypothetical protein
MDFRQFDHREANVRDLADSRCNTDESSDLRASSPRISGSVVRLSADAGEEYRDTGKMSDIHSVMPDHSIKYAVFIFFGDWYGRNAAGRYQGWSGDGQPE